MSKLFCTSRVVGCSGTSTSLRRGVAEKRRKQDIVLPVFIGTDAKSQQDGSKVTRWGRVAFHRSLPDQVSARKMEFIFVSIKFRVRNTKS